MDHTVDYAATAVSIQRHSGVYLQRSGWSAACGGGGDYDGPVAVKVLFGEVVEHGAGGGGGDGGIDPATLSDHRGLSPRLHVDADALVRHEAAVYAWLGPQEHVPRLVACYRDPNAPAHPRPATEASAAPGARRASRLVLVTQFVRAPSIDRLLHTFRTLDFEVARRTAYQVAQALQSIHQRQVVYADLKLPNVLLDASGKAWLVDFGSAFHVPSGCGDQMTRKGDLIGITAHVRAPETFPGPGCHAKCPDDVLAHPFMLDFWAYGVFLVEIFAGAPPFGSFAARSGDLSSDSETWLHVDARFDGVSAAVPVERLEPLRQLCKALLRLDPTQRLGYVGGWEAILRHDVFTSLRDEVAADGLRTALPEAYEEEIDQLMLGL